MQATISYSGLTTKIYAMRSKLLDREKMQEIASLPDVPAVISYLKQQPGYKDILADAAENELHRGQLEPILRETVYRDFNKIYRFANPEQRKFLKIYLMRYEVYFLKQCLGRLMSGKDSPMDLSRFERHFSRHSKLPLRQLTQTTTMEEFLSALSGTTYYVPLKRISESGHAFLFDYEAALDLYYFKLLWNAKDSITDKDGAQELTKILGAKFEMLNMQWIYRCKQYYRMTPTEIYAQLIPIHLHIPFEDVRAMAEADSIKTLETLIRQSYYGKHYAGYDLDTMEANYSRILKTILKKESRRNPYSVATIYSYLYHKEHEVDQLTIALECVRYNLPLENAMAHISQR